MERKNCWTIAENAGHEQYSGTAGRIENAQVAVFLTYAAGRGHTFAKSHAGLIAITLGEARRLFTTLAATVTTTTTTERVLAWSRWRRQHQHRARRAHYQRREGSITAAHRPDLRL